MVAAALSVEQGYPSDGKFKIRVPTQYREEIARDLDVAGLEPSEVLEFSLAVQTAAYLASAGALPALAAVIHSFLRRHDGKTFKVTLPDGSSVEATGYAVPEEEILGHLERLAEAKGEADEEWKRCRDQ